MKRRPRLELNYANVVATIALFLALGGAAVAAGLPPNSVGAKQLQRNAVDSAKLRYGAVTAAKLHNGAVTTAKLRKRAVRTGKIEPHAVTAGKLAPLTVWTGSLRDGSVTPDKLSADALLPEVMPAGYTARGSFEVGGNTDLAVASVSYPITLDQVAEGHMLDVGESSAACPGRTFDNNLQQTPEASPGKLCLYVALRQGKSPSLEFTNGNTALGFGVKATFSEPDPSNKVLVFWAVTPL